NTGSSSGADVHVQQTHGHLAINGAGGAANNSLYGPDANATWRITNDNTGKVTSPVLDPDLGLPVDFSNIGNLTGGATGTDVFSFSDGKKVDGKIDGGGGSGNTLDYFLYTTDVYVNLQLGRATNVFGTLDNGVSHIQNVTGGWGNDILVGDGNGNTLNGG